MDFARKVLDSNVQTTTDLTDSFAKRYKINENDHNFNWLMINEVDPYLVFPRVCQLVNKCTVIKNDRGFDIAIDNIENAVLVEEMKKWVLHRKINICQNYNPNDKISTSSIYRFNTIR